MFVDYRQTIESKQVAACCPLARIIHVGWVKVAQAIGGSSQTGNTPNYGLS